MIVDHFGNRICPPDSVDREVKLGMSTKKYLLASVALIAQNHGAWSADLPAKQSAPIEYVRVCAAYGAAFFYIPGTDTCLRISGRARFEGGYMPSYSRQAGSGDTSGYQGRMRINLDARTQTAYGTLRAFVRLDAGSRTGYAGLGLSGTQQRIGQAYPALGVDQFGRAQQYMNVDKAFIQISGLTAGRASSFFDFYAHDLEFLAYTGGSDVPSTNLLAYTATFGGGLSATISAEDPVFRRTPIFSPTNNPAAVAVNTNVANFGQSVSPAPVLIGYNNGVPSQYSFIDAIQRSRLPDFVGVVRLDQAWGSAQLSAAVHELNVGNISTGASAGGAGSPFITQHTGSSYGFGTQAGIKLNLPMIAAGDTLYLQGAYAHGAQMYSGYCWFTGCYTQNTVTFLGQKFTPYLNDAVISPFSGQLSLSDSFTVVASYLHYWSPTWRSAFFGSYGEQTFSGGARSAQGSGWYFYNSLGSANAYGANAVGLPGTRFYSISQSLRDTYQFLLGANLIWSPVKDLDIGIEGTYTQVGVKGGRVIDIDKDPTAYSAARIASINAGGPVRTATTDGGFQLKARVQRDF